MEMGKLVKTGGSYLKRKDRWEIEWQTLNQDGDDALVKTFEGGISLTLQSHLLSVCWLEFGIDQMH